MGYNGNTFNGESASDRFYRESMRIIGVQRNSSGRFLVRVQMGEHKKPSNSASRWRAFRLSGKSPRIHYFPTTNAGLLSPPRTGRGLSCVRADSSPFEVMARSVVASLHVTVDPVLPKRLGRHGPRRSSSSGRRPPSRGDGRSQQTVSTWSANPTPMVSFTAAVGVVR